MKIETKFSNGDVAYYAMVTDGSVEIPCDECAGRGELGVEGKTYKVACRGCRGRGSTPRYEGQPYAKPLTIGLVRVSIADSPGVSGHSAFSNYGPQSKREEEYMAVETGICSGSVYPVEHLFHTEAEALDCAKLRHHEWKQRRAEEAKREEEARRIYARQEFRDAEAEAPQA